MAADKDKLKEIRKRAVNIKLDLDEGEKVIEAISRSSGSFYITTQKILRYRSPDELDPELNHEEAPWEEQSIILPQGSTSPIVARALLQTARITEIFFSKNSEKYQLLSDISWEVMNSLVSLQYIKERLEKQINEIIEIVSNDMEKYTTGQSPKPLPAVQYYDIEFRSFVNEVKRCLDTISGLFPILTDLKFSMKHEAYKEGFGRSHFHKAQQWAEHTRGKNNILSQMLQGDQRWIGTWIALRVAIEHPAKDKYVETLNFSLEPSRTVRLPTWRFIHPDYDMARPQNLLEVFDICINNLLKFYEDLLITLLDGHLPKMIKIALDVIPEEQRDKEMPFRYAFSTMLAMSSA